MASATRLSMSGLALVLSVRSVLRIEDPGVLAPAALRRVQDERALAQRDACQATGQDEHAVLAVERIRTQVDMTPFERAVHERRHARQLERRLRDVVARVLRDPLLELLALLGGRGRTDEHAVPARLVDRLHDEGLEVRE